MIEKSDDLNVIKENLIKFYKNFDIFKSREIVTKYLVKSEINGLFDKALDEKKIANLPKKELLIGDKKIPVYRLDGRPFKSIIHVISRENQHMSRKLDLKNNPQNWGIKKEGSSILSLSMISNCHEATFGGGFSKTSLDKLVLGFDPIESEEVSSISTADSGTNTDGIGFKNILSAIMGRAQAFENTMQFNTNNYNEISVSRFLPNHEPRKPTYILVREQDIEELTSTSPQVIWSNYFNIPIITLDFKKDYIDKATKPFTNMLNEILSLPKEVQFARLPELMNNYPYMFLGSSIPAKHAFKLFHILELYSANRSKENAIVINNIRIPVYGKKSINIFEFIESSLHNTYYLDSADEQKEANYACDKLTHIRNLVKYDLTSSDIKDKDNSK